MPKGEVSYVTAFTLVHVSVLAVELFLLNFKVVLTALVLEHFVG